MAGLGEPAADIICPQQNHLLAALPTAERERLLPALKLVYLPLGSVLYESGGTLRHIYFPTDCLVSLIHTLKSGASAESAAVGNDGAIGIALFTGGETMTNRAVVRSAGFAFRMTSGRLKRELERQGELFHVLLGYVHALMRQTAQTAVCNRYHSLDQQLCRWLLESLDRLPANKLTMTQDVMAHILGVRRESITTAAGRLQKQGVIRYTRGQITVLDPWRLEQLCCECYSAVKKETDRVNACSSVGAIHLMEAKPVDGKDTTSLA